MAESKFVDEKALASYLDISGLNTNLLSRLISLYINSALTHFSHITEALKTKSFEELRQAAHTLKSSSKMLGAIVVADTCLALENLCHDSPVRESDLSQLVTQLGQALHPTLAELKGHPSYRSE